MKREMIMEFWLLGKCIVMIGGGGGGGVAIVVVIVHVVHVCVAQGVSHAVYPRRRNVTTSIFGLKKKKRSHAQKSHTKW